MPMETLTAQLTGYQLEKDVFNKQGILMLQKGHILSASDIAFLNMHFIYRVEAAPVTEERKVRPLTSTKKPTIPHTFPYRLNIEKAVVQYSQTVDQLKSTFDQAKKANKVELESLDQSFSAIHDLSFRQKNLFHSLHDDRDVANHLYRHSLHTGLIASTMASLMHLTEKACLEIGKAALLHDIGKVLLPDTLLTNPDPSTWSEEEWAEWKKHPRYGYELLRNSPTRNNILLEGCLYHHEQLDGKGYPSGLSGKRIPLVAQIVAAANQYDNLCSHYISQNQHSPYFAARALMEKAFAGELNPKIVTTFIYYISPSYVGDRIKLSNGETGKIVHIHPLEPERPIIQLDQGTCVDLRKQTSLRIEEMLN